MDRVNPNFSNRLLASIAILLGIVALLQVTLLVQRQTHLRHDDALFGLRQPPSWWGRLKARFLPGRPTPRPELSADTVWDDFHQIEHMHAQINRMFEDAFQMTGVPLHPALVASNTPSDNTAFLDPMQHMEYMRRRIDTLFASARQYPHDMRMGFEDGWTGLPVTPGLGVRDGGETYEITVPLPGFDRSSIRVTLDGTLLDVAAERHGDASSEKTTNSTWTVRSASRFERRLRLPQAAPDPAGVKATYHDGVLRIVVPKAGPGAEASGRIPVI